jgi:benzylsuccinate CoA-transferase BbsF subunit
MTNKVFDGIKIAEFAWVVVGPSTSRYFADHGAEVVKIESHKRLDTNRINGPFVDGIPTVDGSMFYGKHNPNKKCISIDLGSAGGKKLAWKMIMWADIVTESFSPGTMEKWGLGYEDLKKVKPDIIYFSSSMQGRGGPHTSYAGYGQNAVNFSGFTEITGWPDRLPSPPYGAYTDYVSCRYAAFALMSALMYRKKTGKGQYLEQSQFETSIQMISPLIMDYQINGNLMKRSGNRHPGAAPHGVYQCKGDDRWVAISIMNGEQWIKFCQVIGNSDLAKHNDYLNLSQRKKYEDALDALVNHWTLTLSAEEVESILQNSGIPSNIVEKSSDIYLDPQLTSRGYFTTLEHSAMGKQKYEYQACYILSKTPRQIITPSPCIGEHNERVFKDMIGMNDDELAENIIDGSITTEIEGVMTSSF